MRNLFLAALVCGYLVSCSSKNKAVNDYDYYLPISNSPIAPVREDERPHPNEITTAAIGRASDAAIEGKAMLNGDIPLPLARVQLGLYRKDAADRWTELSRLTTESQGEFRVTQKLTEGTYELRVLDKNYEGIQMVRLTSSPARGLILQVNKK